MRKKQQRSQYHSRLCSFTLAQRESQEYWKERGSSLEAASLETAFSGRWFGNQSEKRVKTILSHMKCRFDPYPQALEVLSKWGNIGWSRNICHWHLQLSDPLYREFTGSYLPQCRSNGIQFIDWRMVLRWIAAIDCIDWSISTKRQMASSLLTTARQAGLMEENNPIISPVVADNALEYWFFLWKSQPGICHGWNNPYLSSLGLTGATLAHRVNRLPSLNVYRLGDVYDWGWQYPDLMTWAIATLPTPVHAKKRG